MDDLLGRIENLTNLSKICEEEVLKCIERRISCNEYYTWAGPNLLAVNPNKPLPNLYSDEIKLLFYDICERGLPQNIPPHIYAVATRTWYRMVHEMGKGNQIIIISGDSGSGKTYSAWHIIDFLANHRLQKDYIKQPPFAPIEQICSANIILRAFGNAQTVCNGNSSRFGKLLELTFSGPRLVGAFIKIYLLEKTRVSSQGRHERNFHIFYQLLGGLKNEDLKLLQLNSSSGFKVTPGDISKADQDDFITTTSAFQELGIQLDTMRNIFAVLSAILHLGNIIFTQSDDACEVNEDCIDSRTGLRAAAQLLALDEIVLRDLLTVKVIKARTGGAGRRTSILRIPCSNIEECNGRRDSLMRFLYQQLFNWLVHYINTKLEIKFPSKISTLGILDIYGFEVFEKNSLEQLCINYANERLHHYFIKKFINHQHKILFEEGLTRCVMPRDDDIGRIKLFDSSVSVFGIINEECLLKRYSSDEVVCQRMYFTLSNKNLLPVKKWDCTTFMIRHYAGNVQYSMKDLLDKNRDEIPSVFREVLILSDNDFVQQLLITKQTTEVEAKKHTLLAKFKKSLDELLALVDKADVHYIKCIKANSEQTPGIVDSHCLQKQLQASGVLESVLLSRHGFQSMTTYPEFLSRYNCLVKKHRIELFLHESNKENIPPVLNNLTVAKLRSPSVGRSPKGKSPTVGRSPKGVPSQVQKQCQLILLILQSVLRSEEFSSYILMGKSRIFMKEEALRGLENFRQQQLSRSARIIQRAWKKYQRRQRAAILIQKSFRGWKTRRDFLQLKRAAIKIQQQYRKRFRTEKYENPLRSSPSYVTCPNVSTNSESNAFFPNYDDSLVPLHIKDVKCASYVEDSSISFSDSVLNSTMYSSISTSEYVNSSLSSSITVTTSSTSQNSASIALVRSKKNRTLGMLFFGKGIISRRRIVQVPIRFHTKKTCLPYSYCLPICEVPQGLQDALM